MGQLADSLKKLKHEIRMAGNKPTTPGLDSAWGDFKKAIAGADPTSPADADDEKAWEEIDNWP